MRSIGDEEQAKRVGPAMELKQVHNHTDDDDVDDGSKFDLPSLDDDDEDLEDRIAAAHHLFEDNSETISLLSTSGMDLSSQVSRDMRNHTSARVFGCVLIGIVALAAFIGIIFGFTYSGATYIPHSKSEEH